MSPNEMETEARARAFLRKLRDLNFRSRRLTVREGVQVRVTGCLSTDTPVERGVRYAVEGPDGDERVLHLHLEHCAVVARLGDECFAVELDAKPEAGAEELERFLERLVCRAWR
jgi:hypothetical protein